MASAHENTPLKAVVGSDSDLETALLTTTEEAEEQRPEVPKSTTVGATFNLANVIIGSGIMGLPRAVAQAGYFAGFFLLFFNGLITEFSLRILLDSGVKMGKYDYEELMKLCFGPKGYMFTLATIFVLDFGSMVSYIIIIGDTVTPVLSNYFPSVDLFHNRELVTIITSCTLCLPLCLLRDLKSLAFVSIVSVCSVCFVVFVIVYESTTTRFETTDREITVLQPQLFTAFATMSFAYVCHDVSFQVFQSIQSPDRHASLREFSKVTHGAVGIALFFSAIISFFAFRAFFSDSMGNILNNFDNDDNIANAVRFVLAATIIMTYPLNLFMSRHVVARIASKPSAGSFSLPIHLLVSIGLFGGSLLIGTLVSDLGLVQALVGGLAAVFIAFVLPAACALQVEKIVEGRPYFSLANARTLALFAFGLLVTVASTVQTISSQ